MNKKVGYTIYGLLMVAWFGWMFIWPYFAPASSLNVNTVNSWAEDKKDNPVVMKMIKEAVADDVITEKEYRNLLSVIVDINEIEYDETRSKTMHSIKENVGAVK